jgi:hypothetical protein
VAPKVMSRFRELCNVKDCTVLVKSPQFADLRRAHSDSAILPHNANQITPLTDQPRQHEGPRCFAHMIRRIVEHIRQLHYIRGKTGDGGLGKPVAPEIMYL